MNPDERGSGDLVTQPPLRASRPAAKREPASGLLVRA